MRQFVIDTEPDSKGLFYISGKDYRYIKQVLRLTAGDMIKVSANGTLYNTTLCTIDESKKQITLQICDAASEEIPLVQLNPDRPEFYLLQIIAKPQKMELIIRQAVECGVSAVIPVIGEYTQKGTEKSLMQKSGANERIPRIIREARQQSGSPIDTKVLEPVTLSDALKIISEKRDEMKQKNKSSICVSLYERNEESVTMHEAVASEKENTIGFAAVAVGCEGGISPDEIKTLKDAGFRTVHFDANILRCETASLYGMASLQTTVMEGNKWLSKE